MFKKRQIQKASYDKENQIPILKCSICNGEQVAGFKDIHTGKFEEVMLIRNDRDLEEFKEKYGVEAVGKEY
ncbi:MAG: aspartate dehydrogenase [Lachnospiraceae bacterium]|nr:aspartate dehydrogenase [Lachnospiraceae bacterium]MDE7201731.1 aspartate dehydrogenase [Lachnospiraceae bacterium]